ncbi:hypothetical protein [Sideroxydans lithotrophicus]|uniref:hypothetical protein n=1 Tax=Sideroxydans lithotrophicus TaxID=63745 RepID=UPI00167F437C|nr:hypothetical protein [Sideroxydans lithotrophicus]
MATLNFQEKHKSEPGWIERSMFCDAVISDSLEVGAANYKRERIKVRTFAPEAKPDTF